jgi:hypothetical protein
MTQIILIGIGAGLAAALLFLAPVSGTALAFPLFALTGLPIAIAGLGWGVLAGVIAAGVGAMIVLALAHWVSAAIFVLVFGGPLVWLTRLATLSRPTGAAGQREWYPLGQLLLHAAVAVATGLVIVGAIVGFDPQALVREMTAALADWFAAATTGAAPTAAEIEPFVRLNVALLPFMVAILALAMVVADLWLAALVARASGRLERPRDDLWTVALPNRVLGGLAVAALLALVPGGIGYAAAVFAGGLAGATALVGMSVMHALTAGMAGRAALLAITYVLVFISGFPLILFAIVGIGESFLRLRERRIGRGKPH